VGPNFLPWLVARLLVCGAFLVWEAAAAAFARLEEPSGGATPGLAGLCLGIGGILANAALIRRSASS